MGASEGFFINYSACPSKEGESSAPQGRGKVRRDGKQSNKAKALCPAELKKYKQQDDQGRPICWAYNLKGGCKETVS